MEFSLEYMLHVFGVRGHNGSSGTEPSQDNGPGRGHGYEIRVPLQEPVPVFVEGEEAADERVGWGSVCRVTRESGTSEWD